MIRRWEMPATFCTDWTTTTTETRVGVAHGNSTWHAINTSYINSTKESLTLSLKALSAIGTLISSFCHQRWQPLEWMFVIMRITILFSFTRPFIRSLKVPRHAWLSQWVTPPCTLPLPHPPFLLPSVLRLHFVGWGSCLSMSPASHWIVTFAPVISALTRTPCNWRGVRCVWGV